MKNLNTYLNSKKIILSDKQIKQFNMYYDLLIETNMKFNLTTITDSEEVLIKHFFDSLSPSFFMEFSNQKIIDIGAGAGFPSIPLKICYPDLKLTLVDSLNKRVFFLKTVVDRLGLEDVSCLHTRSEDLAKFNNYREKYDFALSRAVARMNILSELLLPFIKIGGCMIALKGANVFQELDEAKRSIKECGGEIIKKEFFELPKDSGKRNIIYVNKVKNTPKKYPRKPGELSKNPISN